MIDGATTCRKCGNALPERAGTGRPALYCSSACRRAAEYEIRRLSRRLERLEDERHHLRVSLNLHDAQGPGYYPHVRQQLVTRAATVDDEIVMCEQRLRALLEED